MATQLKIFVLLASLSLATVASAREVFSHDDWSRVLERFVDDRGYVDYQGLARDRADLDRYLTAIEATSPKSSPQLFPDQKHELAYWINAYNALVFRGVLDRGPETESVWTGGLISGRAFFVKMPIVVGGEKLNLKTLEDDWIRAEYQDPRVHAALNCASKGCPRLPRQPFLGDELDEQLDQAMRFFVAEKRNVAVDSDGALILSKIFDWFENDFLDDQRRRGDEPSIVAYINRYRASGQKLSPTRSIEYRPYDKSLNQQP